MVHNGLSTGYINKYVPKSKIGQLKKTISCSATVASVEYIELKNWSIKLGLQAPLSSTVFLKRPAYDTRFFVVRSTVRSQRCNFKILQDLKCPKAVQDSKFYDWLRYILGFGSGGAVKARGGEDHLIS